MEGHPKEAGKNTRQGIRTVFELEKGEHLLWMESQVLFTSGCQSIGASASVLPMNIQD